MSIYYFLKIVIFTGVRTESSARHKGREGFETEGVRGLKALGVRELSYKTAFLATTVIPSDVKVNLTAINYLNDIMLSLKYDGVMKYFVYLIVKIVTISLRVGNTLCI